MQRPTSGSLSAPGEDLEELTRVVRRVVRARVQDPHLADDLVQETLARVLAHEPPLDADAARPYAIVVAQNLVASTRRTDGRRAGNAHRLVDLRSAELPEDAVVRGDERSSMSRAMARLSPPDREMLISHEVHDVSTKELADGVGTTPGAIAVRLAAARAKLRVEYVLSLRREPPLPPRCRSVLVALSAGDRRRQVALDAEGHLETCDRCAALSEPLRERRRASAVLLPLVALRAVLERGAAAIRRHPGRSAATSAVVAVAVAAAVVAAQGSGSSPPPAPAAAGAPATEEVAPPPTAAPPDPSTVGPVTIAGAPLGPMSKQELAALVGTPVTVRDAVVSAVPADEGFWIEDGAGGQLWVQLTGAGESPVAVEQGATVSFTGMLVATPPGFTDEVGLDHGEGSGELADRAVHVELDQADAPPA